ncbi:PTS sugar transporter subunit IIA [Piscinibacter sakaiensis]|uniref:PTS sugar transporter subunit IIA n=1 Tax=Piscinibacter sakaiensis TaxID=1547922 RepID=UPI003AAFACE2
MPGLLIIAHAPLASALREVAQHTFPECARRLQAFDVTPDMSPEMIESSAGVLLAAVADPDALILTDVVGATPANVAVRLAGRETNNSACQVKVIAGVNVPMLWRALGHADDSIDRLVDCAGSGASEGVRVLTSTRPQNQAQKTGSHDQDASQHQQ